MSNLTPLHTLPLCRFDLHRMGWFIRGQTSEPFSGWFMLPFLHMLAPFPAHTLLTSPGVCILTAAGPCAVRPPYPTVNQSLSSGESYGLFLHVHLQKNPILKMRMLTVSIFSFSLQVSQVHKPHNLTSYVLWSLICITVPILLSSSVSSLADLVSRWIRTWWHSCWQVCDYISYSALLE